MMKNLDLDKSSWKRVKFGDVVVEPKETCKDIAAEGIVHVVGLEHIDTGDIHLRKSATTEESTTFTKKFREGDVLFGRRRAYLKKAAHAKFDGICSGDITVFRAQKNLLPELLPFIVNNDKFFDYAIKHSAGGLSPRVKFKDLSNYEFLLPPKEEQSKLAELLWSLDEVIEKEREVLGNTRLLKLLKLNYYFFNQSKTRKLGELCKISSGGTAPQGDKYFKSGTLPFVRMQHLNNLKNDMFPTSYDLINEMAVDHKSLKLINAGSILLAKSGESIRSEKKAILAIDSYVVNHLAILNSFSNEITKDYLFYFFQYFKLTSLISQTTTPSISLSDLSRIKVPLYSKEVQNNIKNVLNTFDTTIQIGESKISSSQTLLKSLIYQMF